MASRVEIVNKGLQKIGAQRIGDLTENSNNANAVQAVYDMLRRSELQQNFWVFAIKRASIAADSTAPAFGRTFRFALPGDFLRRAPDDPSYQAPFDDILIEGQYALSSCAGPLELRYVADITDEAQFSPLFADALSMRVGVELAEALTQSSSKEEAASAQYKFFVDLAKKVNAIEGGPIARETDEFVAVRSSGVSDPTLRRLVT